MSLIVLAGCAAQAHYSKPGGGEEEYQRTLAKCKVTAASAPTSDDLIGAATTGNILKNCMRAEGWIRDN